MAVTHNFSIEQGSDFNIVFNFLDIDGNPIDLTRGVVSLRYQPQGTTDIYTFLSTDPPPPGYPNRYVTANNAGVIDIQFPADFTQDLDFDQAVYELDFQETKTDQTVASNTLISRGNILLIRKQFNTFVLAAPPSPGGDDQADNIISGSSTDGDQCISSCLTLDLYSVVYQASGITVFDNQENYSDTSYIDDTRAIEKIEVAINGFRHDSPQDLTFMLTPPTGDPVLLSSNSKISNYDSSDPNNKFSFVFSDRADPGQFIQDVPNRGICNIQDKTHITKYSTETLRASFDHLYGIENTGVYTLNINDNDVIGSGSIDSWELIITYGDYVTPTPTPTNTLTPTPTPSITPTITPTASITPTPSVTPSITPTNTPTSSVTPTPTRTVGFVPSPTPTSTPCPP